MRNPFKKYLKTWSFLASATLVALALFNFTVDPFRVYRLVLGEQLDPYKSRLDSRIAKAEMLYHEDCNVLLLGSSRVEVGIDPEHPAWNGAKVLNLGLPAVNMLETQKVLRFALENTSPKKIFLLVDLYMFNKTAHNSQDFGRSRFNPGGNIFRYHMENLLSVYSTESSWRAVKYRIRGRRSKFTLLGFQDRRKMLLKVSPKVAFEKTLKFFIKDSSLYGDYVYDPEAVDAFRQIVAACRQRNIELIVAIGPVHCTMLEAIGELGLWDLFEDWKRDLVGVLAEDAQPIPLWDFTGYVGYAAETIPETSSTEADMKWYWECSHFKSELGSKMLHRIFNLRGEKVRDDFGVALTAANIERRLFKIRADREAYAASHRRQVALVRRLIEQRKSVRDGAE
ncbi:MAG: hypothetical protein SVT52_09555 [Planctomycetota bacterium]|nr:hypothetical protein [Planctomycetota bacterium]